MKAKVLPTAARRLIQSRPSNEFIFEEETPNKGHMAIICTLDAFAEGYKKMHDKYYHELVHGNRPLRLGVDIDGSYVGKPTKQYAKDVAARVHGEVSRVLLERCGIAAYPPLILTGCDHNKFSLHLVWNVGFETPTHCKGFLSQCNFDFDGNIHIDYNLYRGAKSTGTLRMAYSKKRAGGPALTPIDHPSFSLDLWAASLLTFHDGMETRLNLKSLQPMVSLKLAIHKALAQNAESALTVLEERRCAVYQERVMDWLAKTSPCMFVVHQSDVKLQIRAYCRRAQRVHDSNTMFLAARKDGRVVLHCMGTSCKCEVPMLYDSVQAMLSQQQLDIDWGMF